MPFQIAGNPFKSFWLGGFDCSDRLNAFGTRVDLVEQSQHIQHLAGDYNMLKLLGIYTVREGIRWSRVEKSPYVYDWSTVGDMLRIGLETEIQQVWDLCHFGFPDDLTPLHPMFARRFAAMCSSFIQYYRSIIPDGNIIITPINEVSFLSWLGGEVRGTTPYCVNMGWELKYRLMKAYIEGVEAIKEIDPDVIIMPTEPMVSVVPPLHSHDSLRAKAFAVHCDQYQIYDMLTGAICPELRGRPEYLDIIGVNYYENNQWEVDTLRQLNSKEWETDRRWKSPQFLMEKIYNRYHKPLVITETSCCSDESQAWLEFITNECLAVIGNQIPFYGICWYPVIDRCEWDQPEHIHSGFLGVDPLTMERIIHKPTIKALQRAKRKFHHETWKESAVVS